MYEPDAKVRWRLGGVRDPTTDGGVLPAPQMMKRDRIVQDLRKQILSGELARGERMPQDDLARRYDASITPVREALRLLEAEGLLVSEPHRGVRVAGVDLDKVKAAYVIRRLTESYAMRRAVTRLSPRDLKQARSVLNRLDGESASGDLEGYRRDNKEFHFFFYRRCGIPALAEQIDVMWQAFPWDLMLTTPERTRQSNHEHIIIMDAVESGDLDAVASATESHIAHGFEAIAKRLTVNGESVADPYYLDVD